MHKLKLSLVLVVVSSLSFSQDRTINHGINGDYITEEGIDYIKLSRRCDLVLRDFDSSEITHNYSLLQSICQSLASVSEYTRVDSFFEWSYEVMDGSNIMSFDVCDNDVRTLDEIMRIENFPKIVILNDDHARVESRAMLISHLEYFRKAGYNYLAMEAINNIEEATVSYKLGHYFIEPVMGEAYRIARDLGYKIIAYEDTLNLGGEGQRDSIQAINLLHEISKMEATDKVLVYSGHSHLIEDMPFYPKLFGVYIKKMSDYNPLTIDQTRGIKYNFLEDIRLIPCNDSLTGFVSSDSLRLKEKLGFGLVDYFFIHGHTNYDESSKRPTWLAFDGQRKRVEVIAMAPSVSIVQAYYERELNDPSNIKLVTPADQSMVHSGDASVSLFLRPSFDYIIVQRDSSYKVIDQRKVKM